MNIKELGELLVKAPKIPFQQVRVGDYIYNDEDRGVARHGKIVEITSFGELISEDGIYVALESCKPSLYLLHRDRPKIPTEIGSYIRVISQLTEGRGPTPKPGEILKSYSGFQGEPVWRASETSVGFYSVYFEVHGVDWEQVWVSTNGS